MSEAILNTEFGAIKITAEKRWGWRQEGPDTITITTELGENSITIDSPRANPELEAEIEPATINVGWPSTENEDQITELVQLLEFGKQLMRLIDSANEDEITAQRLRVEERERRERQEDEEREATLNERRDILLQELMGDHVKIRHRGYKSTTEATIDAEEDPNNPGEYRVVLGPWKHHDGMYSRGRRNIEAWQRLDVKTAKGWRTVWDDGKDDLPEYDRGMADNQTAYKKFDAGSEELG